MKSLEEKLMTEPGNVSVHDRIFNGKIKTKEELADYIRAEKLDKKNKFPLRRIIAVALGAEKNYEWKRKQAIRFAMALLQYGALDTFSFETKPVRRSSRREMSGETQEYLRHRRRSMTNW